MKWDLKLKRNEMGLDIWYYVFGLIMEWNQYFYFYFFNFIFSHILSPPFRHLYHSVSPDSWPNNRATARLLRRWTTGIIFLSIRPHHLPLHLTTDTLFLSGGSLADPLNMALPLLPYSSSQTDLGKFCSVFSFGDRLQASAFIIHHCMSPSPGMSSVNIFLLDLLIHCLLFF